MNSYFYSREYMIQFLNNHRPFNQGRIPTAHNQVIAFSEYGNPQGSPIVHLHGGPGGFSQAIDLAFFDLTKHRVIIYDQRHCGLSRVTPNWTQNNTTLDLVNDLEVLRTHLNLEKWSIFGGSWGSCLGLCYTIAHPDRVENQIYWGILLGRKSCVDFVPAESLSPIESFYCQHNFFMEENFIINNIDKIKEKPIKIVHGETDSVCSKVNAEELATHLSNCELVIAPQEDHHPFMPQMFTALWRFTQTI